MKNEERLISDFFKSLQEGNTQSLIDLYEENSLVEDPLLGYINGDNARYYFAWLSVKFTNIKIEPTVMELSVFGATIAWHAIMQTRSSKKTLNVKGEMKVLFRDGKIYRQEIDFSVRKLFVELYGIKGHILWMFPYSIRNLQSSMRSGLRDYITFRKSQLFESKSAI